MYNDWKLINVNQLFEENRWSVVHKLPSINGQNVVNEVVKPLAISLNNNNQIVTNFPPASINSSNNLNSTLISQTTQHRPQSIDDDQGNKDEVSYPQTNPMISPSDHLNDYTYYLKTDRDVHWCMEVICYGLSLPISTTEHYETVRDCVQIYCEWIYALTPNKSQTKLIPYPIRDDPNHYFKRILQHLYNIFVPRIGSAFTLHNISSSTELNMTDIISKQALLCHRVLRTISTIAEDEANLMDGESWDNLNLFLLAINDVLLAQPGERDDIGTHLCERVITVLFEIWIMACKRCFPTPSYWKTLQHLFSTWRHRLQVIEQWASVCLIFTQRLVQLNNQQFNNLQQQQDQCLYESLDNMELSQVLPTSSTYSSYINRLIQEMDYVVVSQSWYRFLMIIGNPVDLSSPEIISRTKKFTNFATECVVDPRQHPCLDMLPQNFFKAMKGCAQLVDTFLSINNSTSQSTNQANEDTIDATSRNLSNVDGGSLSNLSIDKVSNVVTPPTARRFTKNLGKHAILSGLHSVNKNLQSSQNTTSTSNQSASNNTSTNQTSNTTVPFCIQSYLNRQIKYSMYRPKINSILKIFGNWLFNAALITSELANNDLDNLGSTSSFSSLNNQTTSFNTTNNEMVMNRRNSNDRVSIEISLALQPENFEAGIAESIGALCRLFSSKQTDEEVAHIYYARFFEALKHGLSTSRKDLISIQILSSILINGTQLFRLNLNGIDILVPDFLKAIELFVVEKEQTKFKFTPNSAIELRRSCIKILLSLLSYPLHFNELPIKDCLAEEQSCIVFRSLKPQLVSLLLNAFHSEKDSLNLQMILCGFITLLEDTFKAGEEKQILGINDDESSTSTTNQTKDTIPDDAKSLYTVVLSSVCHLLLNQKKNDTQVSLAALEVLSQMARIHLPNKNVDESKKATNCICDYIVTQCSRPPPLHSKCMHSTLVAAYQCLTIWFSEHPYLLKDNLCLNTLIEVIELGISGSKSTANSETTGNSITKSPQELQNKSIVFKTFKELKPASMRVGQSAEFLLDCLMNQFGCTPQAPCPPECVTGCCDLNERSLLQLISEDSQSDSNKSELNLEDACKQFKYFISENAILIGFLNNPKKQSSYCLIRSPFGKFCWEMHFQLKGDNTDIHSDYIDVARPISCLSHQPKNLPIPKNFPSSVNLAPLTKIESSMPSLKQVINKYPANQQQTLNQMFKIVEQQKKSEQSLKHRCMIDLKNRHFDCKKPKPPKISDLDCARLIINHLGLMNSEKNNYGSLNTAQLVNLDLNNLELFNSIIHLDSLPMRTCDTAFIYYVRKRRIHPQEILNSVCSFNYVKPAFLEFLSSLGTPINCKQHYGWTGNLYTSWNQKGDSYSAYHYAEHGGAIFDGQKMSIYWADISHEMAFLVPSRGLESSSFDNEIKNVNNSICNQSQATTINSSLMSYEDKNYQKSSEQRSISSYSDNDTISSASHNLSENSSQLRTNVSISNSNSLTNNTSNNNDLNRKKSRQSLQANIGCDVKILIVWLENSEDEYNLPLSTLMQTTNTGAEKCKINDYIAILIHPLKNGLFSIKIISSQDKIVFALPLLDGIVVSKRILGSFIRLTTLNIYKRRRLDMDSFQMPHCKRRQKIQEISKKFRLGKEIPQFLDSLF